jgi:hypothetical protein
MTRFYVQDQGVFIPTNDLAQAFAALNFKQINSLGVGTDTLIPAVNPDNPNWIADIKTQDFWGYVGSGTAASIYRLTNVGIGTTDLSNRFQVGLTAEDFVVTPAGLVGVGIKNPTFKLDISGTLHATQGVEFDSTLDVDGNAIFNSSTQSTSKDTGALVVSNGGLGVEGNTNIGGNLGVAGSATVDSNTQSTDKDTGALVITNGGLGVEGNTNIGGNLGVTGSATVDSNTQSTSKDTGALVVSNGGLGVEGNANIGGDVDINGTLNVDGTTVFQNTVELNSSLIDINNSTATGKFDYRLSSVGTGVSWRPPGVQTQNIIYVTKDGNDSNSGLLEGDAKATVGAAASIATEGDTIYIRSGVYYENNPIGLRTDVSVSGQDLRLVTIVPINRTKDVFHVRRGCLIENISFAGGAPGDPTAVSIAHTGCGAVAFPPTNPADYANSGYIFPGPANEGPSLRWRSPYIRNCTNFMTKSIGMKIDGNHAISNYSGTVNIGNDLKCMVCDSFTQYNENGIGVSITNNAYAQLVSIFTINCDIGIYANSGGSCDLTNSNSSFGNYGLYAVGLGSTEFTGKVNPVAQNYVAGVTRLDPGVDANSDKVELTNVKDASNNVRTPYDGQALFFKINNLDGRYPDAVGFSTLQSPMLRVDTIEITNGGTDYSATTPPTVRIVDESDESQDPKGPQGIIAEVSPTIDPVSGSIVAIDVINSGRNYLPTQNLVVRIDPPTTGTGITATANVRTQPIYYTVDVASAVSVGGTTTITFNERIPYELFGNEDISLRRISRILTSSHSFEYIGTGTSINTSTPFQGAVPIKENEIVALDGAQVPFTSTDQKGNFDIGEGLQINQPTRTIRGRDFSRAIQAEVTPLILALR